MGLNKLIKHMVTYQLSYAHIHMYMHSLIHACTHTHTHETDISTLCQVCLQNQSLHKHKTYIHKHQTQFFFQRVRLKDRACSMPAYMYTPTHMHASAYTHTIHTYTHAQLTAGHFSATWHAGRTSSTTATFSFCFYSKQQPIMLLCFSSPLKGEALA